MSPSFALESRLGEIGSANRFESDERDMIEAQRQLTVKPDQPGALLRRVPVEKGLRGVKKDVWR